MLERLRKGGWAAMLWQSLVVRLDLFPIQRLQDLEEHLLCDVDLVGSAKAADILTRSIRGVGCG